MAKSELRQKALSMRKEGMSYSYIRETLQVSKSTLSVWLRDYPLSQERIAQLQANNEKRIERCRETKARKRSICEASVYQCVMQDIGLLSERELFLAGLFLYWGEGTKAEKGRVCLTNTDPRMLAFFLRWLDSMHVARERIRIKLHLYADMNIEKETAYWADKLGVNKTQFIKPYIKKTIYDKPREYKGRFGHGTCKVTIRDTVLYERIMAGIAFISSR